MRVVWQTRLSSLGSVENRTHAADETTEKTEHRFFLRLPILPQATLRNPRDEEVFFVSRTVVLTMSVSGIRGNVQTLRQHREERYVAPVLADTTTQKRTYPLTDPVEYMLLVGMSALAYFPSFVKEPVVVSQRSQKEPSPSPKRELGPRYLFISGTSCRFDWQVKAPERVLAQKMPDKISSQSFELLTGSDP